MSEVARGSADLPVGAADVGRSSSRLVAREGSFRVYYTGTSGAVPFKWEARPGTPKHPSAVPTKASSSIPPLTPPPSFLSPATTPSQKLLRSRRHNQQHSSPPVGFRVMAGLVPKLFLWRRNEPHRRGGGPRSSSPRSVLSWAGAASSNSSSSSSSESDAVPSPSGSPVRSCASSRRRTRRGRSRFSSFSSTGTSSAVYDEEAEEQQGENEEDEDTWRKSGFSGCSANVVAVKRALMSVVVRAHGSGGQAAPHKLAATSC